MPSRIHSSGSGGSRSVCSQGRSCRGACRHGRDRHRDAVRTRPRLVRPDHDRRLAAVPLETVRRRVMHPDPAIITWCHLGGATPGDATPRTAVRGLRRHSRRGPPRRSSRPAPLERDDRPPPLADDPPRAGPERALPRPGEGRRLGGFADMGLPRYTSEPKRRKAPAGAGAFLEEIRRRPTLPGSLPPSTIGAGGLNFRVRNGNGCDPTAMATEICCQRRAQQRSILRTP